MEQSYDFLIPEVFRFRDTCNVYLLRSRRDAILVDFGSGAVLDHLAEYGVDRVGQLGADRSHLPAS